MSSAKATTEFLALIQNAAASTIVLMGERNRAAVQSKEKKRPCFRVSFMRLGGRSKIPRIKTGVALIECFAGDNVKAWDLATGLTEALGCDGITPAFTVQPSQISHFVLNGEGWNRGNDPVNGGYVYCSVTFHYWN